MEPLLIIDTSHGGVDPGASGNRLVEKDYALLMSLYQYERFKELGVPVAITRETDVTLGNVNRAALVKSSGAKYCFSNHLNAATSTSAQGVEVIHSIYNDGKLAKLIVEALAAEGIPKRSTPVYSKSYPGDNKKDYYFLHRWTGNVQTNIIEYDFITNVQGAQRIRKNWQQYAEAVVRVYCNILGYLYKPPVKAKENDVVIEWAKEQGFDIEKVNEKLTYKELWTLLYRLQGGELPTEDKEKTKEKEVEEMKRPVLRKGSTGECVKLLQELLGITVDGSFGPKTEVAVKEFQRNSGLVVDGSVGPATWAVLEKTKESSKQPNFTHYKESLTDAVEVDPLDLKISVQDRAANKIQLSNFVTSGYQWHNPNGVTYPLGILVSEGKVISDRQPHNKPAGTLIVYTDGTVAVKELLTIKNEKNVWFAVSGCSILPTIQMASAGFVGVYSDIGRATDRPVIGYNPKKKKVVIAVRPSSDINRGQTTLKNLGCDRGITLDGGGSTVLKVNNKLIKSTTRRLYSVITW